MYSFNWLSAPGTACLFAAILSALSLGMSPARFGRVFMGTVRQMLLPELTIASVLGLAFLMNYCGATATLGLALSRDGSLVSILQHAGGLARRVPDGQRYIGQCAVRQFAGDYGRDVCT